MKFFILISILFSNVWAQDNFMETGINQFSNKESYFNFQMGLEQLAFKSNFDYQGKTQTIKPDNTEYINMTNLKIGRDFNYKGYVLGIKTGGFFGYSQDNDVAKVSESIDIKAQSMSDTDKIYGVDVGAHLAFYKTEFAKVYLEPFIEFTTGAGRAILDRNYSFTANGTIGDEFFNARSEESFTYNRWGAGVNLVSYRGIYSFFKVTQSDFLIANRKVKGEQKIDTAGKSQINEDNDVNDFYQVFSGSIGFGLFF
jgi:hypothetical protein